MKKLMILVTFFSLAVFSCKMASRGTDFSLTHISMNDITQNKEIIDLMKTINKTLNWYQLKISGGVSGCSDEIKESNEPSKIIIQEKSLITRSGSSTCVYTLDMSYGVKVGDTYTAYFKGKTDIGGKNNPYPVTGDTTKVRIDLEFISDGHKIENIGIAEATAPTPGSTFADIESNISGSSIIRVKDLFTTQPIENVYLKSRYKPRNTISRTFLLQYDKNKTLVQHVYDELLTLKGFTLKDGPVTMKTTVGSSVYEYTLTNTSNLTRGKKYVFAQVFIDSLTSPTISSSNDTFSTRGCDEIAIYLYTFEYTGATTFEEKDTTGINLVFVPKNKSTN